MSRPITRYVSYSLMFSCRQEFRYFVGILHFVSGNTAQDRAELIDAEIPKCATTPSTLIQLFDKVRMRMSESNVRKMDGTSLKVVSYETETCVKP